MTRVLILAAGPNLGWHGPERRHMVVVPYDMNYLQDPQLLPLIHRTQQQCLGYGIAPIVVTQLDNIDYALPYPEDLFALPAKPTRGWEQEWDGSREYWSTTERTVILLGDTYYSGAFIHALLSDDTDHWHFYARFEPNERKPYGEGLAWVIHPSAHEHLDNARAAVKQKVEMGQHSRASGWEVYREACGLPIWLHAREWVHAIEPAPEILGVTEDFDTWEEYDAWFHEVTGAQE